MKKTVSSLFQSDRRRAALALALAVCGALSVPAIAEPPPGHPSAEQAGRILGLPEAAAPEALAHEGVVLRAMDSNAFTYIEVRERQAGGDLTRWLAAPRMAVNPGARIRFDDGRLMSGFYSRKLRIAFDSITFVSHVAIVGEQ